MVTISPDRRASNITAEMAALEGRRFPELRRSFPITASDIRRWAVAVYWPELPPRLYWDSHYARTTRHGGIVAPEEFNPFAWLSQPTEPDGDPQPTKSNASHHPDELVEGRMGVRGPGLKTCLNGGSEIFYGSARMQPGDVITEQSFHRGYRERLGRNGLMLFSTTEIRWENQHGGLVKLERKTLIRY